MASLRINELLDALAGCRDESAPLQGLIAQYVRSWLRSGENGRSCRKIFQRRPKISGPAGKLIKFNYLMLGFEIAL
jgi:hypothetical protein